MHDFGLKATLMAALNTYEQASRGSGRTHALVASLKGGETVAVWVNPDYVRRMIREVHGGRLAVEVVAVQNEAELIKAYGEAKHRRSPLLIDHFVLHQVHARHIKDTANWLSLLGAPPEPHGEYTGQPGPVAEWMAIPRREKE